MALADPLVWDHMTQVPGQVHGVFAGLNIGLTSGADPQIVAANRCAMLAAMGLSKSVFLNQVHGDDILVLKKGMDIQNFLWNPITGKTPMSVSADALVTDIQDLGLVIQVADCQAVVLYDSVNRVVANVHSGWRGSLANILGRCVDTMIREFGCRPENIFAGISPSLGPCCAEFINYKIEIPVPLWKYRLKSSLNFNFWKMSRDQLSEKGVNLNRIRSMGLCTKCNDDRFFSYRANPITGRFGAVVGLGKGE